MDINRLSQEGVNLVPIARGQHLFPFRTQQLSLGAVTILGVHPWENSTVPNYRDSLRKEAFSLGVATTMFRGYKTARTSLLLGTEHKQSFLAFAKPEANQH